MSITPEASTNAGQLIVDLLARHGVKVQHATDFRGPTVIQHAFTPEASTKLRNIEALSRDIALALGLEDVRIVAPIPGTSFVGVEVPRSPRETVTYADFNAEPDYRALMTGKPYALPIPIGVTIGNDPLWADLTKTPHLLIAGSTGSGKSVALSTLITSLIDHKTPDELRLWLIDPKRVELGMFEDAPQVERIATDCTEALELLEDVVEIMDSRYEIFEMFNVRNISEYNALGAEKSNGPLPYHVVVIDELADLMLTAKKDVETHIVRIAQLARAAGIHLVLATQRPTVDVVTGLIGANVPSRWTFAVRSVKDSMVALDQTGAQALYGQGDSLWLPAGADKPTRVQAVWTDDVTIERVVARAGNIYDPELTVVRSSASPRAATEDDPYDLEDLGVPATQSELAAGTDATRPIEPLDLDEGFRRYQNDLTLAEKLEAIDREHDEIEAAEAAPKHREEGIEIVDLAATIEDMVENAVAEQLRLARVEIVEPKVPFDHSAGAWTARILGGAALIAVVVGILHGVWTA